MAHSPLTLDFPCKVLPRVLTAGTFPMIVPGCNRTYSHESVALHLHDYAGRMWIGSRLFELQPGDITFSPGTIPSRYDLAVSGTHLCIHFLPLANRARREKIQLPLHYRAGPELIAARERLWRIIDHLRQSGAKAESPASWAASAALLEFLLWLNLQSRQGMKPRRSSLVEEALTKLHQAIDSSLGRPMLIGELAAHVGLSAEYVARLFAARYGMRLQRYILLRRIELARHLLLSSDLSISDIGYQVGIPDPQYFNKQFRRIVDQSPLAFRNEQAAKGGRSP